MQFKEETLSKNYIYKGKVVNLRKDEVLLPNGKTADREIIEHNGGSAIVCECEDKIVLVRQYRYAYGEELWEIPAGKLNLGEDPKDTAIRELSEECGIIAGDAKLLRRIYPTPGYTNEVISIYKAIDIKKGERHLDEDEFLSSKWFTKTQLKDMIDSGKIVDAKTIIGLLPLL